MHRYLVLFPVLFEFIQIDRLVLFGKKADLAIIAALDNIDALYQGRELIDPPLIRATPLILAQVIKQKTAIIFYLS
jgi:hypothetical protein